MLVLSRRVGETIVIDGGIRITVVAAQRDRIRLGISAPDCVQVDREEIYKRRTDFIDINQSEASTLLMPVKR